MNKNKIKVLLEKNKKIYCFFRYIYVGVSNPSRLKKEKSYGEKNKDKHILLIRPNTEDGIQGLMSLFIQTMRWVDYAKQNEMIPFIDFKNYKTQYADGTNSWEYFFTQPSNLTLEEVYDSKNVTILGTTLKPLVNENLFRGNIFFDKDLCKNCYDIIWNNIRLSAAVEKIVAKEDDRIGIANCIGAYLRGTDYIKLKPAGEYVQPEVEEFIEKLDEFVKKYPAANIFLVTEDYSYYQKIKTAYKEKVKIVSFDSFVVNYDGKDYLSKTGLLNKNPRKRGMDYLAKIVLLSRCKYLVSSITMGSIAAYSMNGGKYEDEIIFDKGVYQ